MASLVRSCQAPAQARLGSLLPAVTTDRDPSAGFRRKLRCDALRKVFKK